MARLLDASAPDRLRQRVSAALSTLEAPPLGAPLGVHTAAARSALAAAGLGAAPVPEAFGGLGLGVEGVCTIADEAAAEGFPFSVPGMTAATVGSALLHHGTAEQQAAWLPGLAAGETVVALAVSEPDTGARLGAIRTEAKRHADGWVLDGRKTNITGAGSAAALLVVARTGGPGVLSLFLVPTNRPGVAISEMAGASTPLGTQDEIEFHDVALGPGDLVGDEDAGIFQVFSALDAERLVIAATTTGLDRRLVSHAFAAAPPDERVEVMGAYAETEAARLATVTAARLHDETGSAGMAVSVAKHATAAASRRAVEKVGHYLPEDDLSGLDRTLGMLERFPVDRVQLSRFLLERLG